MDGPFVDLSQLAFASGPSHFVACPLGICPRAGLRYGVKLAVAIFRFHSLREVSSMVVTMCLVPSG